MGTLFQRASDSVISFKLPEAEIRAALEQLAHQENESVHKAAKRLMMRSLTDSTQQEILHAVEDLAAQQRKLRADFATLLAPLLAGILKQDPKAVTAWIQERLAP